MAGSGNGVRREIGVCGPAEKNFHDGGVVGGREDDAGVDGGNDEDPAREGVDEALPTCQ